MRADGLLVVDHAAPPTDADQPGVLTVVLGSGTAPTPDADVVIELSPLLPEEVGALVETWVAPDEVADATGVVLAAGAAWPGEVQARTRSWLAGRVTAQVEVAARRAGETHQLEAAARADLVDGVQRLGDVTRAPAVGPAACPWRGLSPYEEGDAAVFSGRERLVAELVARLAGARLVLLTGPSGSGKSSLLRAGLVASVAAGILPGSETWPRIVLRPGEHPARELTRAALAAAGGRPGALDLGSMLEHLVRGGDEGPRTRVLLVVDQLEEVWTACPDGNERTAFLDALDELVRDPGSPVTVVLSLRSDYAGELAQHRLAALAADATVLVGAPTPSEVRRAVERPAAWAGLVLDEGLADAVVTDAGAEPGLLPLLSTCLTRLWEQRTGDRLTLASYVAAGGLAEPSPPSPRRPTPPSTMPSGRRPGSCCCGSPARVPARPSPAAGCLFRS